MEVELTDLLSTQLSSRLSVPEVLPWETADGHAVTLVLTEP